MTTFPRAESRRLYSWWWDSHISPKNSKWLQENLTDMDMKVKAMIKLIEEDADSFARRAEMYYKKRPELMKLVEEFYRAYRALAERYDHATGALRHAHRTMAEAFPNHIPLALPDESISTTNSSEMPSPNADGPQKDAFNVPTPLNGFDKFGQPEEDESLTTKKEVKQFNEMLIHRKGKPPRVNLPEGSDMKDLVVHEEEVTARVRFPEGKVRKSLNFDEEEEDTPNAKIYIDSKSHLQPELKEKENVRYGVKHLQDQVNLLSNENQKLKIQIELESKHLNLSRAEVENLRIELSKLESEKDAALLQKQLSHENIRSLENEISEVKHEIRKISGEMEMAVLKLSAAEQQCVALEKANQSLQLELDDAKIELEELKLSLNESGRKLAEAAMSAQSNEQLCNQSNEKVMLMTLEIQNLVEILKEAGRSKVSLEEEVFLLKDMNYNLNEHNLACAMKMKHLEDEIVSLKQMNARLQDENEIHAESKKVLQQELESMKDDKIDMDMKLQNLTKEMEAASAHIESLLTQMNGLQYDHAELKECCSKLEDEKLLFLDKLKDMELVLERNSVLETSLSDANVELEELREKIAVLEGSCKSLNAAVSVHVAEKTALSFQIEILRGNVDKLSEKNMLLENSLDDANTELEGLRSKLRDIEESYQSLSDANSDLIVQKNNLISQLESIQLSLLALETAHTTLEGEHLNLIKEKDLYVNKIQNLEDSFSVMFKENESLIHSKNIRLASLENELHLLHEDRKLKEDKFEEEQQKCLAFMTELFILQKCLSDMSNSMIIEKHKYELLFQSGDIQLSALENQIHLLKEEGKVRDDRIEQEQQKSMSYLLQNFVLQRCLSDMKEENIALLQVCQKHLEASRHADELIKQLEGQELVQKDNIVLLMEHIAKVRDGIQLLLKPLNINQEVMNTEGSEVTVLPTVLGEINTMLASIADFRDKNQLLCMEISICLSLLKQAGVEKVILNQEIEKISKQLLVLQKDHSQLFDEFEQIHRYVSAADITNIVLKAELKSFARKLLNLSEKACNLMEERNDLEKENSLLCVEAMMQEQLHMFFRSANSESLRQLKLLSDDLCSLRSVKNGLEEELRGNKAAVTSVENENKQLKESLSFLEDLKTRATISEFDLCSARSLCEELALQVDSGDNLLKERRMELSRVNDVLQSKQGEVTEASRKLEISIKEVDEAKIARSELENRIAVLSESAACKDKQIASVIGEKRTLNEELNRFKAEVAVLKMKEQGLSDELQEEKMEVHRCEKEIMELFSEVQASLVNATILDEKMIQLASRSEGLEVSAIVMREILKEEIVLKNTHAVELKEKLEDFANENRELRMNLKVLSPLFFSLGNCISEVEEQVCLLEKLEGHQEKSSSSHHDNPEKSTGNHDHSTMTGVSEMHNLIAKVESLQSLVMSIKDHLYRQKLQSTASLDSVRREIEELKLKKSSFREQDQAKEGSNMIKDIELDQVSSSCGASHQIQGAESNDPTLNTWAAADIDYGNRISTDHDIMPVNEPIGGKPSSELLIEKDVGVYRLETSREIKESQEEWNRNVLKRLVSDAEKLAVLHAGSQELKLKIENSGPGSRQNRLQFDITRAKLKEAEEGIHDLVNRNGKLTTTVKNGEAMAQAERTRVLEDARSVSDRIGMLELELQKIDYIFLKLEEDRMSYSTGGGDRTPRVLLKDYLYGKRVRKGKMRGYLCGCMRPRE